MGLFNLMVKTDEIDKAREQIKSLYAEKRALKEELEDLKLKKRLEAEEIKHMVRINEEKNKQELENEKIEVRKKAVEEMQLFKEEQRVLLINSLKDFHTKMEDRFNSELGNLKEVYGLLMQRLPNVNLSLTKKL